MDKQYVTIKGLVCKNGKVLMLKDKSDDWELPGGRVAFGENIKDALRREFYEELGVAKIKIGELIDVWDFVSSKEPDPKHFIVIVFVCHIAGDENIMRISSEHSKYQWIDIKKIEEYQMRTGYRESIKKPKD